MFALKKYEDELYNNLVKSYPEWEFQRCFRQESKLFGNTIASWMQYKLYNADLVHATAQTVAPAVYFHNRKKYIVTVLDLAPLVYPSEINNPSLKLQWILTPRALKKADHIIAISEFTKKEIIRLLGIDEHKISVIYLGVDHERYKPMDKEKCKKALGLNFEDKYALVVSSNAPHKRMDLIQKIYNETHRTIKNFKFLKVGYADTLPGQGIINLGWIPEEKMPILYNAADVFLHTSEYEGFGLPVLEAMACGIPVIVNTRASLPEIVGDCGHLINFSAPDYLNTFSNVVLQILRQGSTLDGQWRSKLFTWEKTALETHRLYEKVIEN